MSSASGQPAPDIPVTPPAADWRARALRGLPLAGWLAIAGLSLVTVWMIVVTIDRPAPDQWGFRGYEVLLALGFGSVGALVAARRPENRIGWLTLGLSLVSAVQGIVDQYPVLAVAATPPLPWAEASLWVASWIWVIPSVSFVALFPLIFPDGHLLSRRWRWAVALGFLVMTVQIASIILAERPFGPLPPTVNITPLAQQIGPFIGVGYLLYIAAAIVSTLSIAIRYRRSPGVVRQQIKWVAYAMVVVVLGAMVGLTPIYLGQVVFIATVLFAVAAIAVAILRYRLYEIDVIINRTLVYGALTAILAGVYTASITLSQRVFMAVTGDRSDAAIVLTTLIVAATFTPLKTRLQAIVDARLKPAAGIRASAHQPASDPAPERALDLIVRLGTMRDQGLVTPAEFEATKAELLRRV